MTDRIQEELLNDLWDEDATRATPVPVHECTPHDQSEASHLRTTGGPHPAQFEARSDFQMGLPGGGYTGSKDNTLQKPPTAHSTEVATAASASVFLSDGSTFSPSGHTLTEKPPASYVQQRSTD